MSSWVIVGASRGIGLEYVQQLSNDPNKIVVATIRSQASAGPLNQLAAERKNIHVILTDISSPPKLQLAAEEVSNITGGGLDVLVFNAFLPGTEAFQLPTTAFAGKEAELERELIEPLKVNVIHLIHAINAFLPLVRKGSAKKIIYITSGNGDVNVSRICEIPNLLGYCTSKAAGNIVMAKYHAELKREGIKTLSLSPGWVDTDSGRPETPEAFDWLLSAFQKIQPDVTGPTTAEKSVRLQLGVIDELDAGKSGMVLSQNGNDTWF
ncbi:hypothetical protein LTR37_007701 [Vermiconidia calcicola]|uniref:Uncharacterized protein n=1 Tax=Vermiconidia calcicola TaxID=1690605 RepID=A0ACC3NCX4_9PEZI|nr:hypothetical protein LTR37_007701 [Vermiconidia calcicola]